MVEVVSAAYILLLSSCALKGLVLLGLARDLYHRWQIQTTRYRSDFPFLMAITFFVYGISKFLDIGLYLYIRNEPSYQNLYTSSLPYVQLLGRVRFVITLVETMPYFYLMLLIWLHERSRWQKGILGIWTGGSLGGIFLAYTYTQLLIVNVIITVIPVLLSIITYSINHVARKMPTINNFCLAWGWGVFLFMQIIRPVWQTRGTTMWGWLWIAELVEILPLLMIWYGFRTPSRYMIKFE